MFALRPCDELASQTKRSACNEPVKWKLDMCVKSPRYRASPRVCKGHCKKFLMASILQRNAKPAGWEYTKDVDAIFDLFNTLIHTKIPLIKARSEKGT